MLSLPPNTGTGFNSVTRSGISRTGSHDHDKVLDKKAGTWFPRTAADLAAKRDPVFARSAALLSVKQDSEGRLYFLGRVAE